MQLQQKPGKGSSSGSVKKAGNRWGQKNHKTCAQQSQWPASTQDSLQGATADEAKDAVIAQARSDIQMFEAMLASLHKFSGPNAESQRSAVQDQIKDAKTLIIAAKPLDSQQKVL